MADCTIEFAGFRARAVGPGDILAEVRALFPAIPMWSLADCEAGGPLTTFEIAQDADFPGAYRVAVEGQPAWVGLRRGALIPLMEWALTEMAVTRLGKKRLLLHAGAVAHCGQGLLLPAVSRSGKTTLTAALIAEGFQLCSDEVGMLDPATGHLVPFPKLLCVKEGAHALLSSRYPRLFSGATSYWRGAEPAWYVEPPISAWSTTSVPIRFIVFPRYQRGSHTHLTPLARSAALPLLLEQSFSARHLGAPGIKRAVSTVQNAECYSLKVGDLATAISLLRGLYDRASTR